MLRLSQDGKCNAATELDAEEVRFCLWDERGCSCGGRNNSITRTHPKLKEPPRKYAQQINNSAPFLMASTSANGTTNSGRHGWVPSPDTRGTMDIIWPCLSTLILCLFSMLHLNVPERDEGSTARLLRKLRWFLLSILAPELPMLFAFSQLSSARQSVRDMKALGIDSWTVTHGFYADSGGFLLEIPGINHPFPITAKQLAYLVAHDYIDSPVTEKDEIDDKSTADGITKCLVFFQSGRLITILVTRAASGLQITPFELTTAALVFCSTITLCLWWHKPLNVMTPTKICAKCHIDAILSAAGDDAAEELVQNTRLDFIEPGIYWCSTWSKRMMSTILWLGWQVRPLLRMLFPPRSRSMLKLMEILHRDPQ